MSESMDNPTRRQAIQKHLAPLREKAAERGWWTLDEYSDHVTRAREEAEQLDREGRYTTALPTGTEIDTCRCLRCGSLVGDRDQHDAWHAGIDR